MNEGAEWMDPGRATTTAAAARTIHLVDGATQERGSAWVAVLLRHLRYVDGDVQIQESAADELAEAPGEGSVFIVGWGPSLLTERARLVQRLTDQQAVVVVSGRNVPLDVVLALREFGACAVIDSLESTRIASRLLCRLIPHQPTASQPYFWDELPFREFATAEWSRRKT